MVYIVMINLMNIYNLSRMTHVPEVVRMEHASQGKGLPKEHCHFLSLKYLLLSQECVGAGGSEEGSCAGGFGVCCTCKLKKIK